MLASERSLTERLQGLVGFTALALGCGAVLVVIGSYLYGYLQPVRWPTLFYFWLAFFVTLYSERKGVILLVFLLPLVPQLHWQFQFFFRPAVPYFVTSAGIDLVVGLMTAFLVRHIAFIKKNGIKKITIPLPVAILTVCIFLSTVLAISRNLWQSTSEFLVVPLMNQALRFKLFARGNDFSPIADWLAISIGLFLLLILANWLKGRKDKDELIFKPTILSLGISASYGIFQALTAIGLPIAAAEYRPESFGYSAFGFQPDIHAYAAHMMLGAVGLFGVLSRLTSNHWWRFTCAVIVLCWIALFLSKSRASLVFSLVVLLVIAFFSIRRTFQRQERNTLIMFTTLGFGCAAVILWLSPWLSDLVVQVSNVKSLTFDQINLLSSRRLELFISAIRMFLEYPLLGLGQGNFLLSSAVVPFSHSAWMAQSGGENAHNYFLQALADTGVIGFICYVALLLWPLCRARQLSVLVPVSMAIISLFLGNVYSHSFLIRENLLLLCVFMALAYSYALPSVERLVVEPPHTFSRCRVSGISVVLIGLGIVSVTPFAVREIVGSFGRVPFERGSMCIRPMPIRGDGWTTGLVTIPLAADQNGVRISADVNGIPESYSPQSINAVLEDDIGAVLLSQKFSVLNGRVEMEIAIPSAYKNLAKSSRVRLSVDRCYTPSNLSVSEDNTRLGIHINKIERY
ncbi:O-antigen ligase family protein [Alcaligenaceae bacterium LF4-65]|uniref:O-antigen ligase family protein n=1 Tax=Zwartia hollandica TaxID=324606 RepID=A0A953T6S9_9BURK|nr:O-antigen ligase family protein [Zwartia hollandica]MBZ1350104.1 O-antigen ligase family protein [Zwartia hollandica]